MKVGYHISYIENCWDKLKYLNILDKKHINNIKEPYKMYLYVYYGFLSELKKYSYNELILSINDVTPNLYLLAAFINNIKIMKYLENRGFNVNIKDYVFKPYIRHIPYIPYRYKISDKTKTYILKNNNFKLNKYSIIYFFGL